MLRSVGNAHERPPKIEYVTQIFKKYFLTSEHSPFSVVDVAHFLYVCVRSLQRTVGISSMHSLKR